MTLTQHTIACLIAIATVTSAAHAVSSAEFYTSEAHQYGRFEARIRFAAGDGVVSSFFLWKNGSEVAGTFWNELDFEKLGADCHLETNAYFGSPAVVHSQKHVLVGDLCGEFHTYAYEWTPDYIAWQVDGIEIRRESGATAAAYSANATAGMQMRFNIWPGDASFGGNFRPSILPLYQFINWAQYSSYSAGAFTLAWRQDFDAGSAPTGWLTGNWGSPKNLSTHAPGNVNFVDGFAVLALTADNSLGTTGVVPSDTGGTAIVPASGAGGATGAGGSNASVGGAGAAQPEVTASDGGGCRVAVAQSTRSSAVVTLLGVLAGAVLVRRRRAKGSAL